MNNLRFVFVNYLAVKRTAKNKTFFYYFVLLRFNSRVINNNYPRLRILRRRDLCPRKPNKFKNPPVKLFSRNRGDIALVNSGQRLFGFNDFKCRFNFGVVDNFK